MKDSAGDCHFADFRMVFFPVICLALGLILDATVEKFRCSKFSIPITVFQLLTSLTVTATAHNFLGAELVGRIGRNLTWIDLEPHTIMGILLPTLIFESAFKMEVHELRSHVCKAEKVASTVMPRV